MINLLTLLGVVHLLAGPASSQTTRTVTVSAPLSTSFSYTSSDNFKRDALETHNLIRAQHNVTTLAWNTSLASSASAWSSGCVWKHSGGPTGENLAAGFLNTTAAVKAWGDERRLYDWRKPDFAEDTGHFTQVVWKATSSVGCGRKLCSTDTTPGWYVVCEYWPSGNVIGDFEKNVLPQISKSDISKNSSATEGNQSAGRPTPNGWFGPKSGSGRVEDRVELILSLAGLVVGIMAFL
ncbi:MAG: hypothetical protein M1814_003926 [Vezdaea aestivalis]|nr:MAG: hypothetical protein M1814_003926 [Vezdaea aestivalis]